LYLRNVGPTVDSFVSQYGDTFVDAADGFLRNYLSDSYVDSLSSSIDEEGDRPITSTTSEEKIDEKQQEILRSMYATMKTIERDEKGVPIKAITDKGNIFTPDSEGWDVFLRT